jgi:organic hydroperoxide reductase OsmC/OhrA
METTEQPKIRHKNFTYKTSLTWLQGKTGTITSDGKPDLHVSSPPEFKGEAGAWTPEDLFVASVEMCHMTTFMSFANRVHLPVLSYRSQAVGYLDFVDGDYRFTRIVLTPHILAESSVTMETVSRVLEDSHRHCIISNSISTLVEVKPLITLQ